MEDSELHYLKSCSAYFTLKWSNVCFGTLSPLLKNCTTKKRKPQANAISCLYRELFRRHPIFVCFPALSDTGAHNGTHISRSNTGRARASIFRSSQKGQEGLGEGEGKNTLGMSYWFLLPFFTQLKLIHSRTYEFGRLCRQRRKLLI
jgi:hypothetical protein